MLQLKLLLGFLLTVYSATILAQFGPPIVTTTTIVEREVAKLLWVPGTIVSRNNSLIASRYSSFITDIIEVGTVVQKGEILARIDSAELEIEKKRTEANIKLKQARTRYLERQLLRQKELYSVNGNTVAELDSTEINLAVAKQELQLAKLALEDVQLQMQYATISAPFNAIVSERFASLGEVAIPHQPLLRITDLDSIDVQAKAPARLAKTNAIQDSVLVRTQAGTNQTYITAIVPVTNNNSRQIEIRATLDSSSEYIVGDSVWMALKDNVKSNMLIVPRDALVLRKEGIYIFLVQVGETSIAKRIRVDIIAGDGDYLGVRGELKVGDLVVVKGAERLRNEQEIQLESSQPQIVN